MNRLCSMFVQFPARLLLFLLLQSAIVVAENDIVKGPPMVTAKSWVFAGGQDGGILYSKGAQEVRQIASLSKIMTALIVLSEVEGRQTVLSEVAVVSLTADKMFGTSAMIHAGERLTIEHLLYGLLLPSGNDAAIVLAEHFGRRYVSAAAQTSLLRFVDRMNSEALAMGLRDTVFLDPHGVGENRSTATDIFKLSRTAMANPHFRAFVDTAEYEFDHQTVKGEKHRLRWRNTNELVTHSVFDGLKTGYTSSAGGCLVLSGLYEEQRFYIVVLGSSTKETRFLDAYNLFQWGLAQWQNGQQANIHD